MIALHWLFWGVVATLAEIALDACAVGLRLTRMSLPLIMGTMWTGNRDRAKVIGLVNHIVNGLLFTLLYMLIFHMVGVRNWWSGGLIGLAHAALVLLIGMEILPSIHPRMASERSGPTLLRRLEPPGFLASNYGPGTPICIAVSHVAFGIVLGAFRR
jgi:hypothetical protein